MELKLGRLSNTTPGGKLTALAPQLCTVRDTIGQQSRSEQDKTDPRVVLSGHVVHGTNCYGHLQGTVPLRLMTSVCVHIFPGVVGRVL